MCGRQPLHACSCEQVQPVLRIEAQRLQSRANCESHLLKLDEALVLVGAELKVLPLLVYFLLLAIDHLLDLLRLFMYVDDAARADCLCVSVLGGCVPQDIVQSLYVVVGLQYQTVLRGQVAARHRLALDLLCIRNFACVGPRPVVLGLGHQLLEVLRHLGGSGVGAVQSDKRVC
jgi:hypothetical protein